MEETKKKICKMCFQEIDRRAKKCPHCHHVQSKFRGPFFTIAIPVLIVATAAYSLTQFVSYRYMFKRFKSDKPFSQYQDQIVISNAEMKFGIDECDGPTVAILGKIKNNSDVSWQRFQIEIQYLDGNKKLTDTVQESDYDLLAPAKSTVPFKVSMNREFPEEEYDSFNIRIISAQEQGRWF